MKDPKACVRPGIRWKFGPTRDRKRSRSLHHYFFKGRGFESRFSRFSALLENLVAQTIVALFLCNVWIVIIVYFLANKHHSTETNVLNVGRDVGRDMMDAEDIPVESGDCQLNWRRSKRQRGIAPFGAFFMVSRKWSRRQQVAALACSRVSISWLPSQVSFNFCYGY